ncbi:Hypothetical predicted protein [Podarcis lilfordi]|uniref:Uncharacterized protein n=1 Tax=Podarcis lilfordi TaxID=74358 RepID=A0AA35PGZ4_9SAUR|nr:Hypothetical predicted protein [Podarcis lilfordi]
MLTFRKGTEGNPDSPLEHLEPRAFKEAENLWIKARLLKASFEELRGKENQTQETCQRRKEKPSSLQLSEPKQFPLKEPMVSGCLFLKVKASLLQKYCGKVELKAPP